MNNATVIMSNQKLRVSVRNGFHCVICRDEVLFLGPILVFAYGKTKAHIDSAVTAQLISTFIF